MNLEPDPEGGSGTGDDTGGGPRHDEFDAIVSGWRREGDVPRWPDSPEHRWSADQWPENQWADDERPVAPLFDASPADQAPPALPPDAEDADDHFVPPDPPPLPRLGPPALVGLVLLALGLILIISPAWMGVPPTYGLPLGLVSIASGLGWLVLRLWPDRSAEEPPEGEDGAIL